MEEIKKQIIQVLNDLHPEVDNWDNKELLVRSGLLNSLDIVTIISELSDIFDISIPPQEISYDNFDTLNGLITMVERLSNE